MPEVKTTSANGHAPYLSHGMDLNPVGSQAVGYCPLCGKEGKWYCSVETGLWDCKSCGEKGNALTFLRKLADVGDTTTVDQFTESRGILDPLTMVAWGVTRSPITREWLVAGYSAKSGELTQLYQYTRDGATQRPYLKCTAGMSHDLHGVPLYSPGRETLYLCEGPWDGMALWEVLRGVKEVEGVIVETANEAASLLATANVLAVPGCNVFRDEWVPLFAGKRVVLLYDNDHPRKNGQRPGYEGMKRVAGVLAKAEEPPAEIHYLEWGSNGYDPNLSDGYDIRDALRAGGDTLVERAKAFRTLLTRIKPAPKDWIPGRDKHAVKAGTPTLTPTACTDWKTLVNAWRLALKWTPGLDRGLSCMLAVATSTEMVGDQLWMKIIGPPSCGKSVLCEALSVSKEYIYPKSTLRGFHSGYDDGSGRNHSPLQSMRNKTLITKDGDTLLQSPNLTQILSEGRDVYDRVSRSSYRTTQSKDWEGLNITWLLCGTASLRAIDQSELGERFLDCVIVDEMDEDLEDEIAWRVANRAAREMSYLSDGVAESRDTPEMVAVKRLTGGYVNYLRQNAIQLVSKVESPEWALRLCQKLGKFVAILRAKPGPRAEVEKGQRELSFRLVSQHVRLAKCLAVVLNRPELDEEVMARVRMVARDTARGRTLAIVQRLYEYRATGLDLGSLSTLTNFSEESEGKLLRFLHHLKVVERKKVAGPRGIVAARPRWHLTARMSKLYEEVIEHA